MVEPGFGLHGHMRSMSSLASTIKLVSPGNRWNPLSPPPTTSQHEEDFSDGLNIPLPPSSTCSNSGYEITAGMEQGSISLPDFDPVVARPEESHNLDMGIGITEDIRPAGEPFGDPSMNPQEAKGPMHSNLRPPPSLEELIQAVRKDQYEEVCLQSLQHQVHERLHRCAILQRGNHLQSYLYRLLIDQFRLENKPGFSLMYKDSVKLRKVCSTNGTIHFDMQDLAGGHKFNPGDQGYLASWIYRVSTGARDLISDLLQRIRMDPGFLAGRLTALSHSQMCAVGQSHHRPAAMASTFQVQKYVFGGAASPWNREHTGQDSGSSGQANVLLQQSPLSLILRSLFDDTCEDKCLEYQRRIDVWSTACAQVIMDGKRGSDELCMHILDGFARSRPWSMQLQLESCLVKLIQEGAFLLDSSGNQPVDFTKPAELSNARVAVATSEFFEKAMRTLIDLITRSPPIMSMPSENLDLIRNVLGKIKSPEKRTKARNFFVSRWYCASFLSNALIYPESCGIMMRYYISSAVRQKILKELALRLQKTVIDVLSSRNNPTMISPEIQAGIERLLLIFEPDSRGSSNSRHRTVQCPEASHKHFLMLSLQDVLSVAEILYPEENPLNAYNFSSKGSMSSLISLGAGSSTLTSGIAAERTGTASSNTPSFSGTSMTSDTISSATSADQPDCPSVHDQGAGTSNLEHLKDAFNAKYGIDEGRVKGLIHELKRLSESQAVSNDTLEGRFAGELTCFYIQSGGKHLTLEPGEMVSKTIASVAQSKHDLDRQMVHPSNLERETRIVLEAITKLAQLDISGCDTHGEFNAFEAQLHAKMVACQLHYDFQSAHFWWRSLQAWSVLPQRSRDDMFCGLADSINAKMQQRSLQRDIWSSWIFVLQGRENLCASALNTQEDLCEALRDKMWYISDIRHSATYEDALNVTRALRSMARSLPARQTGVAAWARHRLRTSIGFEKAQAQTLEALAAEPAYGGPAKLTDQQVDGTSRWLTDHSIENFCKGEERIHRFCLEVQKCANKLVGENLLKSPVLWSSSLYQHEVREHGITSRRLASKESYEQRVERSDVANGVGFPLVDSIPTSFVSTLPPYKPANSPFGPGLGVHQGMKQGNSFQPESPLPNLPRHHPTTSNRPQLSNSDGVLGNPAKPKVGASTVPPRGKASVSSLTASHSSCKLTFINRLKETAICLLLSDLGYLLWNRGSETDRWISSDKTSRLNLNEKSILSRPSLLSDPVLNLQGRMESGVGSELPESASSEIIMSSAGVGDNTAASLKASVIVDGQNRCSRASQFPYLEIYEKLLTRFSLSSDPGLKIGLLYELTLMIKSSMHDFSYSPLSADTFSPSIHINSYLDEQRLPEKRSTGKPRTRATRLEEVVANCEERRRSKAQHQKSAHGYAVDGSEQVESTISDLTMESHDPDITPVLKMILNDPSLRPKTLFRDLQYIAALVPASILDNTPQGKAFWDVGLAALLLKADICKLMVDRANQIVAYHLDKPKQPPADISPTTPETETQDHTLAQTTLSTAARLYTVTALEGDPTAARELALFYLAHPEIVARVTLPLSRPSEVFKSSSAALGSSRGGKAGPEGKHEERGLDPLTFAVAFHWMEFAANGGDVDAKAFLKGNGELGKGW